METGSDDRLAVLVALKGGPVRGAATLIAMVCEDGSGPEGHIRFARAIRDGLDAGTIRSVRDGGSVRLSLSPSGKRLLSGVEPGPVGRKGMKATAAAGAALVVAGCMTAPQVGTSGDVEVGEVGVSVEQIADSTSGAYFATCSTCREPTAKTPVEGGIGGSGALAANDGGKVARVEKKLLVVPQRPVELAPLPSPALPGRGLALAATRDLKAQSGPSAATVYFGYAQGALNAESKRKIMALVWATGTKKTIKVRGTADSQGDRTLNNVLALARARGVRDELVALGVDPARIRMSACGSCYIAPNDSEAGRAANRSVTIEAVDLVAMQ